MAVSPTTAPGRSSATRLKFAALTGALGVVLLFTAVKFQTLPYLTSAPIERRNGAKYSRVWIDTQGRLVGAFQQGKRLTIERWGGDSWHVDFKSDAPAVWSIAPDFRRIAWVAAGEIHSQSEDGAELNLNLDPGEENPLMAGAFSDGSTGAVFPDATVTRWDSGGRRVDSFHASMEKADQAAAESDYVALASGRTLLLYRLGEGRWKLVQQARGPEPPFRLLLPAPGMVAELGGGALRIGDETRNTPGATNSAASRELNLIATGDFDGALVLPPERDHYRLADARPGSVVAASDTRLAISGPGGTALLALGTENRLTATGRALSTISLTLLGVSALVAFSGVLLDLLARIFGEKRDTMKQAKAPIALLDPPVDLVKAVASEQCVLWAGAGLAAQAGYPARPAFATMLMQAAAVENWVDGASAQKLQAMCGRGRHEESIDELAQMLPRERVQLSEFVRATYARFAVPSRAHETLMRLPFPAAITANYDLLLDDLKEVWLGNTLTLGDREAGTNFVFKLFGNLKSSSGVLVSHHEFEAAANSSMGHRVAQILEASPVLFLGCSAAGLLADLEVFHPQPVPAQVRYAVIGVSGSSWRSQADQLFKLYGIQVLVCSEETIASELPTFLEKLREEVEELTRTASVPAEAGSSRS